MRRCGGHDALLCSVPLFGIGVGELLVVLVVVLLVFGPGRLPEMMGNLGKAMREFRKGLSESREIEKAGAFWSVVVLVVSVATPLHAEESKRMQVGATFHVEAAGCENKVQEFTVTAPGRIDRSKPGKGARAGWELVRSGNGSNGVRNVRADGNSLTFTLWANGDGLLLTNPINNQQVCRNPTSARSAADVFAWVFAAKK
jgi:sec-independent protein translocase protein TatA